MGSWLEFGTLGGYIAGAGTVTALHMLLSSEQMLDWGWRIPFLVAGPLGLLGLYMRMKLEETRRSAPSPRKPRSASTTGRGWARCSRCTVASCWYAWAWCWCSTSPITCC